MRIQINISDEMVGKIDSYAKKMGISRSALCANFIGQCVMSYDKSFEVLNSVGARVGQDIVLSEMAKEIQGKIE